MSRVLICIVISIAAAVAGCGGGGDDSEPANRPDATPTATQGADEATDAPRGLDLDEIAAARDDFVQRCETREEAGDPGSDEMSELKADARVLIDAFKTNPDEPFRRSAKVPKVTMGELLRSLAFVARTRCGGGDATKLGDRFGRVVVRDGS